MLLKIKNSIFPDKLRHTKKNVKKYNCSFQKDLQILFLPFFDKMQSFCYNRDKYY